MIAIVITLMICITIVSVALIHAVSENIDAFNLGYKLKKREEELTEIKRKILRIEENMKGDAE